MIDFSIYMPKTIKETVIINYIVSNNKNSIIRIP
jgi:hypothetical protein